MMRTSAIAALALALPLFAAGGSQQAMAGGGWFGCDRGAAYYRAPVRAYRYSYRPAYAYRPRFVGFYRAPRAYAWGPSYYRGSRGCCGRGWGMRGWRGW